MNTYITLACLLAVLGLSQGSAIGAYGYGTPWVGALAPAVSTANLVKAAPISVIRTHAVAPIVTAPVLRTVNVGYGGWGGYGLGGLGWGGYGLGWGGHGLGWGGHGLGWGGLGWGGHGAGVGSWGGYGWGGLGGKHYG